MRVWIDQDLCTGDGICVDHCPDVFVQLEDGIAYVAEDGADDERRTDKQDGEATFDQVVFHENSAPLGGGIYARYRAQIDLDDVLLDGNTAISTHTDQRGEGGAHHRSRGPRGGEGGNRRKPGM